MSLRWTIEGEDAVLRFPANRAHDLRVAIAPRVAGETPSASTDRTRKALDTTLAKIQEAAK